MQPLHYPDPDDSYQGDEPSYHPGDSLVEPNFQVKDLPEIKHAYESLLSTDGKFLAIGIAQETEETKRQSEEQQHLQLPPEMFIHPAELVKKPS